MSTRSTLVFSVLAAMALSVAPVFAADGPLVEVPLPVDVYAEPGGVGKPVGVIEGPKEVNLATKRDDDWCKVYGANVPGGTGWIWCGMGDDGKNYAVKPVAAEKPAEPDMGGGAGGGGGGAAEPIKSECKIIGPNEGAGGGSDNPKVTFKCVDIVEGENKGKKECCFYTQP
jgi:hypothetical protein